MNYVFDSGPFILMFRHYYPDRFPSLWEHFDSLVSSRRIISVKEVSRELQQNQDDRLSEWVKQNKHVFEKPTVDELTVVSQIFQVKHFQGLIRKKERLAGKPVADPFVIAKAKYINEGCVVTTEKFKKNASQIPNVCEHFNVPYKSLEEFMECEDWIF